MVSLGVLVAILDRFVHQFHHIGWEHPHGIVFQIEWGDYPLQSIKRGASIVRGIGGQPIANLCICHPNQAIANTDRAAIASALHGARQAASENSVVLQCDTFEDVDRGFCPRLGFIDSLCNLRILSNQTD